MSHKPYTIVDAYRDEIAHWKRVPYANVSLLMAFTLCLKLRLEGTSFDEQFPQSATPDYRAD